MHEKIEFAEGRQDACSSLGWTGLGLSFFPASSKRLWSEMVTWKMG